MSAPTTACATNRRNWTLERVLFAMAGTMILLSIALSLLISPWFLALTAFVGVSQWLFVIFGACPASLVITRLFSFPSSTTGKTNS
ncbi:MAG: DUF2892 domain-containing protein [Solirubrobacterales bacterium]